MKAKKIKPHKYVSHIEMPIETMSRESFRKFVRDMQKQDYYAGSEGRLIFFCFDSKAAYNLTWRSLKAMFRKRGATIIEEAA